MHVLGCLCTFFHNSRPSAIQSSHSLMYKYHYACLTTEIEQKKVHHVLCSPLNSTRQIYTSSHSLINNNKQALSHSIFLMTPSLPHPLILKFAINTMVLGMVCVLYACALCGLLFLTSNAHFIVVVVSV